MATKEEILQGLRTLLERDDLSKERREVFERRIEEVEGNAEEGSSQPSNEGDCPDFLSDALDNIERAVDEFQKGVKVDEKQVRDIVLDTELTMDNIGDDIKAFLNKSKKIKIQPLGEAKPSEIDNDRRPIFDVIYSDLEALNNVYLYGGAGTGKTFMADEIAKALDCYLIEINCNQYTSPLELIGGQTIEGFVQGKLIKAWANLKDGDRGVKGGMPDDKTGCLLLLDELPKIDPNTAGILNSALAKVKLKGHKSEIEDSSGVKHEKKRFFCMATGNTKLNEDSTDYVANFKQDLSLQDRFAGSTYELFVDLTFEYDDMMASYLWIWSYFTKLRFAIQDEGWDNQAFVSIRIMESIKDTWLFWYANRNNEELKPKTVKEGAISFFELFTNDQARVLKEKTGFDAFVDVVKEKQDGAGSHKFDYLSSADKATALVVFDKYKSVGSDREL